MRGPIQTFIKWAALVAALGVTAAAACAEIPKIPGYVRIGDSTPSVYAPCVAKPYVPYKNPGTAPGDYYYRYDGSPMLVQKNVKDGTSAGQGGATHTTQVYLSGMIVPVISGLHPPIPFPPLPGPNDWDTYSRKIAGHPDWIGGIAAFKQIGHYAEDCSGVQPTAVPTGRPTPGRLTPTPTKSPVPPDFCCDPSGFIHGTAAPCPEGTPKCTVPTPTVRPLTSRTTTTPVPPTPAPAKTAPRPTATATKRPLPPVTVTPSASASPEISTTTGTSPTPSDQADRNSLLGLVAAAIIAAGAAVTATAVAVYGKVKGWVQGVVAKVKGWF